ncbi:hypothetical protein SAMN04488693_1195 [Arthrobacter subterraneus]|uniref:Uncharacterized protein n=2 Tax=Arthrobacter subterraneus TaxID=335973 RepID=A0A1G8MNZ1_9MICC|nr:hypothetical protein SAMN04488693_1195 [Arthrobacter subterraneus]
MGLLAVTIAVTLGAAITQLSSLNSGLDSSAAAAVYSQQQEIDEIFVERPEYLTYFEEGTPPPSSGDEASRVRAISYRLLDHFEHVRYQIDAGLFEETETTWNEYFGSSFEDSPALCAALVEAIKEYDGTGGDTLWAEHAKEPCGAYGIHAD